MINLPFKVLKFFAVNIAKKMQTFEYILNIVMIKTTAKKATLPPHFGPQLLKKCLQIFG
jgi:hypothetical protein